MATRTAETPKVKKTPVRRCLAHLPATCEAALAVLNDAAWAIFEDNNDGLPYEMVRTALGDVRKILKDGLSAVEPKRSE